MSDSPLFGDRYKAMSGNSNLTPEEIADYQNSIKGNIKSAGLRNYVAEEGSDMGGFYSPAIREQDRDWLTRAATRPDTGGPVVSKIIKDAQWVLDNNHNVNIPFGNNYSNSIDQHETSHSSTKADQDLRAKKEPIATMHPMMRPQMDANNPGYADYLESKTEQKARVDVARKFMLDNGIYDATKEVFTIEHLKNTLDFMKKNKDSINKKDSSMINQLNEILRYYKPEDVETMMNSFVQNDTRNEGSIPMAAYGGRVPQYGNGAKFAAGGVPPTEPPTEPAPTRSDSIALYNNALAKAAFYDGLDAKYDIELSETDFLSSKNRNNIINSLEESTRFNDSISNKDLTITQDQINAFNVPNSYLGEKRFKKVPGTNLSSFGDIRRGGVDSWFNPSAPPILLHPNISPQGSQTYNSKIDSGFGDTTDVPYYDPIAVAPWDTLNVKQKEDRINKYGIIGTPLDNANWKPERSPSSLKREKARNALQAEMDASGFKGKAREVLKKGSEAEKAYQKYLGNYTKKEETPKETVTPKKDKVELPKGYSYRQDDTRDGDINDYFKGNKRMKREDWIKATGYSPTQFRERHVEVPEFRDGGPINNDGPLAKPQGDIYLPFDGTRPSYTDASGKERSEYKIGIGTKEGEMVIPTVWNGKQHTEDEAIDRYYNTGEHMGGPYGSIEKGERAAKLRTFIYNEHPAYRKKAYGGCAPKYAQGGQLYEAEGGEVIDGGNPITLQGGHISPNSSNSGKIVGNSHGNGGVKMTGGEKIYSDRLTVDASFLKDLDI